MAIMTSATCEEWLALGALVPVSDETNRLCSDFVHRRLPFAVGTYIDWSAFRTVHRTDIGTYDPTWAQSLPIADREQLVFWFPAAGRGFSAPTVAALKAIADLLDWPPSHNFCFAASSGPEGVAVDLDQFLVSGYGDSLTYAAGWLREVS